MRDLRFRPWWPLVLACACAGRGPIAGGTVDTAATPPPAPAPIRLTLVGTNDVHGWVYPQEFSLEGGKVLTEGGMPAFAGYLAILRRENPDGVLLLDGGDMFQGTLPSNLSEGQVVITGMNALGYTAAALGNHEFDYGPVGPSPVALEPEQDPFGALKARIGEAKFPVLAANVEEVQSGLRPAWLPKSGSVLVERNGVKVGILGLITPQTPYVTNPVNVASLRFTPLAENAIAAAAALRAQGAEVVIALAHAGGRCARWDDSNDLSSCEPSNGEIFAMMDAIPEGTLDAVIAGHTHAPMGHFLKGTPVVETTGMGKTFGMIDLAVDPVTRKVLREQTRISPMIPICAQVEAESGTCDSKRLRGKAGVEIVGATFRGQPVISDQALAQKLEPARTVANEIQQRPLGLTAPKRMLRSYEDESGLGLLLADALRSYERADLALLNPGGLRADLRQGELTYGDLFEVLPFDNTISTVTVNGEQLRRLFEAAYSARKGVFQPSGAKVKLSRCQGPGRLLSLVLEDGKPPDPNRKYRVVMPDFLARGGDGLGPMLGTLPPEQIDLGLARSDNYRDAIVTELQKWKKPVASPPKGRVTFADDAEKCAPAMQQQP